MTLRTTDAGQGIIKAFEKCELRAYLCPAGKWTIGWGHTVAAGPPSVVANMMINRARAEAIFVADLGRFEAQVNKLIGGVNLTPYQYDAIISFAFNIGAGNFAGSTVLKRMKRGDMKGAAESLLAWNKATVNGKLVVLNGLVRRRKAEQALFLGDVDLAFSIAQAPLPKPDMASRTLQIAKPKLREPITKSVTGNTAAGLGLSGLGVAFEGARQAVGIAGQVKATAAEAAELVPGVPTNSAILVGLGLVISMGAFVMWWRRYRRSREDEVVEVGPEVVS